MKRTHVFVLLALALAACIPEPVRTAGCASGARRCSPTALPLVCVAGDWTPDNTPRAISCALSP